MLFDRMMNRPMQSFGMGQTYVPDSGFDGGGTGGAPFRHNTGIVPPHMQTGGGGQMSQFPMQTGGPSQMTPMGSLLNPGGPGQAFQVPGYGMHTGGPQQMGGLAGMVQRAANGVGGFGQMRTGGGSMPSPWQLPHHGLF